MSTTRLVPWFPLFSEDANQAIQRLAERYVALASRLPEVKQVQLEGAPPQLQFCTLIEADPGDDDAEFDRVYQAEEQAIRAVPAAPAFDFRVINRVKNHSRDFEGQPPDDIHILFQRQPESQDARSARCHRDAHGRRDSSTSTERSPTNGFRNGCKPQSPNGPLLGRAAIHARPELAGIRRHYFRLQDQSEAARYDCETFSSQDVVRLRGTHFEPLKRRLQVLLNDSPHLP